jgi:hypothetical protein
MKDMKDMKDCKDMKDNKDNGRVIDARDKAQLNKMIEEWSGLSVVDYRVPSGRAFSKMDKAIEEMASDKNKNVRYIRANLEDNEFKDLQDEIPSNPHYRFYKNNKNVDHLDGAYMDVFREKVDRHSASDEQEENEGGAEEEHKTTIVHDKAAKAATSEGSAGPSGAKCG